MCRKRGAHLLGALSIIFLFVGCEHFHAKTFFTTNPLYYTDLIGRTHEEWELLVWDETERVLKETFPQEIFKDLCAAELHQMLPPKSVPYHAFNYNQAKPFINSSHQVVFYPLGRIDILFHEYIHARNSQWSEQCLSEMLSILLTRSWEREAGGYVLKVLNEPKPR